MTNHMWVGYWMTFNGEFWNSLPKNYQDVVESAFSKAVKAQRAANAELNGSLEAKLQSQGLTFNKPELLPFRQALVKAGYYTAWKDKLGPQLSSALETYTGPLG